jgi:hypothetical protein
MRRIVTVAVLLSFPLMAFAEDVRHQPLEDLNGYFPTIYLRCTTTERSLLCLR